MRAGQVPGAGGLVSLSRVILGSSYLGSDIDREASFQLLDTYYALGGRTLDTARVYAAWIPGGEGAAERTIGDWMLARGNRAEMTVITKGGHPPLADMHCSRLSRQEITADLEASLQALQTDYVDVYLLHRDDPVLPVEDIMDTLHDLVLAGKIRAIGASNWRASRIAQANAYAAAAGKTPFSLSEIQWSLAKTSPDALGDDTLVVMDAAEYAAYREMKMPVLAYSPQSKGFFSKCIAQGVGGLNQKIMQRYVTPENLARLEQVKETCRKTGLSPAAVTLCYITCNPLNGFAIVGCSNPDQLRDSMTAADAVPDISGLLDF